MELVDDVTTGDAAVGEQLVQGATGGDELAVQRLDDHLLDLLGPGGGGDGVHRRLVDRVAGDGGGLEGVQRPAHVAVGDVGERVDGVVGHLDPLGVGDRPNVVRDGVVRQWREPEDGTPGLDRVDDLAGVVTRKDEPDVVRELFHRPAECRLGRVREGVGLIEEDNPVVGAAKGGAGEGLDPVTDHVDPPLVGGVEFEEVVRPVLAVKFLCDGHRGGGLPRTRRTRKEHVAEVVAVDVALEALGDRLLAHDIREPLWTVLLQPDLLATAGVGLALAHTQSVARAGHKPRETEAQKRRRRRPRQGHGEPSAGRGRVGRRCRVGGRGGQGGRR